MPRKVDPNKRDISETIYIGDDKDGNPIAIEEKSLLENGLLIIGTKNSGKEDMLSQIAFNEFFVPFTTVDGVDRIPFSISCATFVTSKPEHSYYLYAIPKKYKRHEGVMLVSPSTNMKVRNELLGMKTYDYEKINEILDFTKACKENKIAIIDMENFRYEEASIRAVGMLLLNLQVSMHDTNNTNKKRHYLTIDDAWYYLPYLTSILKYGSSYNVSTTLTFDSRSQYKEYETIVENNIQNYLLMGNLRYEDAKYFSDRFGIPLEELLEGGRDHAYLAAYDSNMHFSVKKCFITKKVISEKDNALISTLSRKYKRELEKASADEEYVKDVMLAYAQCVAEQNKTFEIGTTYDTMQRVSREIEAETLNSNQNTEKQNPKTTSTTKVSQQKDSEDVHLIGAVKQLPVAPQASPKPVKREVPSIEGLKQLMGIVESAPTRIQKQLKEEGFPVQEKRNKEEQKRFDNNSTEKVDKQKTNSRSKSQKNGTFNPFGKNENSFKMARNIEMPVYDSNQVEHYEKKTEKNKKQNKQVASQKKENQNKRPNNTHNPKKDKVMNSAKKTLLLQKQKVAELEQIARKEEYPKTVEVKQEQPPVLEQVEESKVTTSIEKNETQEQIISNTNCSSEIEITMDEIVIEEEPETPENCKDDDERHRGKLDNQKTDIDGGNNVSETPENSFEEEAQSSGTEAIQEKDMEDVPETPENSEEVLELFENAIGEPGELFGDGADEETLNFDMNKSSLKSGQRNVLELSEKLAGLSVQPRSSGENFSNDGQRSTELIERLKERGHNTNFFSKRREIEVLKKMKN